MHRQFAVFLSAILIIPLLSSAQSTAPTSEAACTPVDLRSERIGPIRDTKDMNWSYAHAAADMLTQRSEVLAGANSLQGERISAEAIAIELQTTHTGQLVTDIMSDNSLFTNLKDDQGQVTRENKTAYRALTHLQKPGEVLCLESEVGSRDYEGADLSEVYDLMDHAATIYRGSRSENFDCNSNYGTAYGQVFPTLSLDEIIESLAKSSWSSTKNFVALKDKACKTMLPFPAGQLVNFERFNQNNAHKYYPIIQRELNEGHLSLITFNEAVLTGATRDKMVHATIAGRRFNGGVCEVLVRTTYGESCERYKTTLTCEGGHLWISETELAPSIQRITTLDAAN